MTVLGVYVQVAVFALGLVVGSFLNVVIYRLHTGKSLGGHSHCLSCRKRLRWYELIPLVSYMALRGRCGACSSFIPGRYALVELLTGVAFLTLYVLSGAITPILVLEWVFVSVLIVVLFYDLYHTIIPNELVGLLLITAFGIVGFEAYLAESFVPIALHATGGVLSAGFFALLWLVSRGRWIGLGDAKLAASLGTLVGVSGVFSFIIFSFWVGAVVSILLLGAQWCIKRGQHRLPFLGVPLTMKSEVPFAPFLIAGFVCVYLYEIDVFSVSNAVLTWFVW